jgi:hypothetical protein
MPELEIKPTPPDWEPLAMRAPQLDTLLAQAEALTKLARGARRVDHADAGVPLRLADHRRPARHPAVHP